MATPNTAPISLLVLVAEAAIPERSGGTTVRGTEVTGTSSMPMPIPAMREHPAERRELDSGPENGAGEEHPATGQQAAERHRPPGARPAPRGGP